MPRSLLPLLTLCLSSGCVPKSTAIHQPYKFEARPTHGVVKVMPVIQLQGEPDVRVDGYVGAGVSWLREWLRERRTTELERVPAAVGVALPAAVNGVLGDQWDGQFRLGRFPVGARATTRAALRGRGDVDLALGGAVRAIDAEAALFTWVRDLEGTPLTAGGFPGEIVQTSSGPVVIDFVDEPYLVEARLGMALVAADGEVVMRYEDNYSAVLTGQNGVDTAASGLATAVAEEVGMMWASDPRLELLAPSDGLVLALGSPQR